MTDSPSESFSERRRKELGFKPQNEVVYNANLPYAEHLDDESIYALSVIKTNLSRVVLNGELRAGLTYWASQLTRYVKLYGLKFSLEDHVLFVKLLYEVVVIPDLEFLLVERLCNALSRLLKKRELLNSSNIQLDWLPLYKLADRVLYSKMEPMGLEWIPVSLDNKIRALVRNCRQYFPLSSSSYMLDEWRPLLCPFDVVVSKAVKYFEMFLPTLAYNENERKHSWKLWIDEFLILWRSIKNGPSWEKHLVALFARLAHNNIGYIDWSDYIIPLFTRVMCALSLPVGKLQQSTTYANQLSIESSCLWIVSMMGSSLTKVILDKLRCLLEATETFFHPSNLGKWSPKLFHFIQHITGKFVNRIFRERYKVRRWEPSIPTDYMITDQDIEEFVLILKPVALLTLFSKLGSMTASKVLQHLAYLRADLILPSLLDKSYVALTTLTEPHQVKACLTALSSTIGPAISGFPEVRLHIIPLLFQCLPALDPNDRPKSTVAFQFISNCLTLLPFVDCSDAPQFYQNLSDGDKELCSMTSQFEDFVVQFFDRCFILIEGMNQGNELHSQASRSDSELLVTQSEGMSGLLLVSAATMMLEQVSEKIFQECLEKLFKFATTHLFEGHISMSTSVTLCAVSAKANPVSAFEKFIPYYCHEVLEYFEDNPDAKGSDKIDKQFLWDIKMLTEISHIGTIHVLQYKEMLFNVAKHAIEMTAKDGYEAGVRIVKFCIRGWTLFYTHDRRSVPRKFNESTSEYLAIKDWGATMSPWEIDLSWHVPCEDELEAAFEALEIFLDPALVKLSAFIDGSLKLSKEDLQKTLYIVKEILGRCYLLLPAETENPVNLQEETAAPLKSWPVHTIETLPFYDSVLSKNHRRNLRSKIFSIAQGSLHKILATREDDVDSVCSLIDIYSHLFLMHEQLKSEFDQQWKVFSTYKTAMRSPFKTKKQRDRFTHIDRTVLQQRMRILAIERSSYTILHHNIMLDLISLSTSHYMKVRGNAQALFFHGLSLVPHVAYKEYLPLILKNLVKTENIGHQQFKGALYLLIGPVKSRLFLAFYQKWDALFQVWPALINAPHSDKPSIAKLYEKLAMKIQSHFFTLGIKYQLSTGAIDAAVNLAQSKNVPTAQQFNIGKCLEEGKNYLNQLNEINLKFYHKLVDCLINLYESGNLTWKYSELVLGMISLLLRSDVDIPVHISNLFVSLLNDDAISVRTLAIGCLSSIFKQQKRKHVVEMVPISSIVPKNDNSEIIFGNTIDNTFIQYKSSEKPDSAKMFNNIKFIDKTHWGYYCWPNELKTYAPYNKQPELIRKRSDLLPAEYPIYDNFTNKLFVDQMITYLCLENEKGKDKFDDKRVDMFKGLFRNFGDVFLSLFQEHILRLVEDKQETHQRCAAEIITGLVMGAKHWDFDKLNNMWAWLIPALHTALLNISVETLKDWDTAFSHMIQNRDPRRIFWILEFLVNEPLLPSSSALVESSRLYVLQGGIHQQEWRVPELLTKILNHIEPKLGHPYKNIRNRYGSLLASLFLYDVKLNNKLQEFSQPLSVDQFIDRIMPRLEALMSEETFTLPSHSMQMSTSAYPRPDMPLDIDAFNGNTLLSYEVEGPEMENLSSEAIALIEKRLQNLLPPGSSTSNIGILSSNLESSLCSLKTKLGKSSRNGNGAHTPVEDSSNDEDENDNIRSEALRTFKTILKWIVSGHRSSLQPFKQSFLKLLPLICKMYPVDQQGVDEELHQDSRLCLSCIAQCFIDEDKISIVVETIENIVSSKSWHARHTVLNYIQVFVFTNLFSIRNNEEALSALRKMVLGLLQDEQHEVYRLASVTLCGLVQCGVIPLNDSLLNHGKSLCSIKLKKKSSTSGPINCDSQYQKLLLQKHAGILILSACVLSAPYTVPTWMPEIVMCLSDHLHDPQPIQGTIKRTLSDFRRTHHDNWHEDKMKFTSDELAILTDLLVSPSYYA